MKKFAAILSALMMMVLAIVPMASASADTVTKYIDASNGGCVNVRTLPAKSGSVQVQLGVGFPVTVLDSTTHEGWSEIKARVNGRVYYGYVANEFLKNYDVSANSKQTFTNVKQSFQVTVRPSSANGQVNLWTRASRQSASIRVLTKGESLTVVAASHAWYKVIDSQGNEGYVAKAYVKK